MNKNERIAKLEELVTESMQRIRDLEADMELLLQGGEPRLAESKDPLKEQFDGPENCYVCQNSDGCSRHRPSCVPEGRRWAWVTDGLGRKVAAWERKDGDRYTAEALILIHDPDSTRAWVWWPMHGETWLSHAKYLNTDLHHQLSALYKRWQEEDAGCSVPDCEDCNAATHEGESELERALEVYLYARETASVMPMGSSAGSPHEAGVRAVIAEVKKGLGAEGLKWREAPALIEADGYYWLKNAYGRRLSRRAKGEDVGAGIRDCDRFTHIAGPIPEPVEAEE